MPTAASSDPRSVVTPDAFEISDALLGLPLATPSSRAFAMLIDGIVIGIVTALTQSFGLILGIVAAIVFVRMGFKRTRVRGSVFDRAMRMSVGCLGLVIGVVTASVWFVATSSRNGDLDLPGIVAGISGLDTLEAPARETEQSGTADSVASDLESLDDGEALRAYADLLQIDSLSPADEMRRTALEARLTPLVAAGTFDAFETEVEDLEATVARLERETDRLRAEVADDDGPGLFARILDLVDTIGFGFGWGALYMTVMLSWWNGQTVGKKLMKIRVLRLDGEPINWWVAFERSGGYAAGLATGLLGFAQVWWDANRQMIHDRIVGTVVVIEGADKVIDWEHAL